MTDDKTALYAPVRCVDCGHDFHPDSSPHQDRCWVCAELADSEAGEPE